LKEGIVMAGNLEGVVHPHQIMALEMKLEHTLWIVSQLTERLEEARAEIKRLETQASWGSQ
jgi:hypothetical protein